MTEVEIEQARMLRAEGKTYKQIGDIMCYSTGMIHHVLGKQRRNAAIYEDIVLKGFYDYFKDNPTMTIYRFTYFVFNHYDQQHYYLIERMLKGQNVNLSIKTIRKLQEITGKSFNELFEKRKDIKE